MDVAIEIGPKRRTFASACDWPGLTRSGRDASEAITALVEAAPRYAAAVGTAWAAAPPPSGTDEVKLVERLSGSSVTDFGAICRPLTIDRAALDDAEIERLSAILTACWRAFDGALDRVPGEMRDIAWAARRSANAARQHVVETDRFHLVAFDLPAALGRPRLNLDRVERATRSQFLERLKDTSTGVPLVPRQRHGFEWTARFAVRRSAWHALDHAWDLEDRLRAWRE